MLVWAIMAAILVAGVVVAVKGSFWLLIAGFLLFILFLGRVCMVPH